MRLGAARGIARTIKGLVNTTTREMRMLVNPNKGEEDPAPDKESRLDLSATQVLAAAGAATLGAVLATLFGVYGTIIGTAVLSLVTSVGSVLLVHFTQKTKEKIKAPLARSLPRVMKADQPTEMLKPGWDTDAGAYRSTQVTPFHDPDATQPLSAVDATSVATGTATVVGLRDDETRPSGSVSTTLVDMEPVDVGEDTPAGSAKRKKLWISIAISTVLVFVITIGALSIMAIAQDKKPSYYFGPSPAPTPERVDPSPQEEDDHQPPPEDNYQEDEWDGGGGEEPSEDENSEPDNQDEQSEDPDEEPDDSEDDEDEDSDEDDEENEDSALEEADSTRR